MTRRNVLDAICCVIPMSGMVSGQIVLRAMQMADGHTGKTTSR